jgi:methyltransferase-like protein
MMNLVIKGYVNLSLISGNKDKVKLDKPKLSKLAMYQATGTTNNWVTNLRHGIIAINHFDKFAMKYMDGTKSQEDIVNALTQEAKSGKMTINKEGKQIEKEAEIKKELAAFLDNAIEKMSKQALFV